MSLRISIPTRPVQELLGNLEPHSPSGGLTKVYVKFRIPFGMNVIDYVRQIGLKVGHQFTCKLVNMSFNMPSILYPFPFAKGIILEIYG